MNNIMKSIKFILSVLVAGSLTLAQAQGLEGIIVEKYYITDANDASDADAGTLVDGSTVYRIFVDMAPGYDLETVFGNSDHGLRFETSTFFFNNEDRGSITANGLGANFLNQGTVLIDSYLSMGAGGSGQWAVVKSDDTDGSIDNIDGFLQSVNPEAGIPFATADGLTVGTPPAVTLVSLPGVFDVFEDINFGPSFSTNNAAWAVLGGTQGPDAENRVLIAQLTTDGEFSFSLNLRLGAPDGSFEQYVASDAIGDEIEFAALNFPVPCIANGGTLQAPANRSFCVGTGSPQAIGVTAVGAVGTNQRWGLIDNAGNVLETRVTNSNFNLDTRAPGNYSIRYIRYEDDVTNLASVTNISQVGGLVGCFGFASNAINIFLRDTPVGGVLSANGPNTVCANQGPSTSISVALSGNTGEFSRFGLTSAALGNQVVSTNATGVFNLNGFVAGTYRVVHLSYQEGVNLAGVQFASDLDGCFELSNLLNVSIVDCPSAMLESNPNPTAGQSFVTFTNPVEEYATLEVYDMSGRMVERLFNQVTQPGQEYRLEFTGYNLPNGVYLYRLTTDSEVIIDKFMIAR
jgi:hypothetical protein